MVTPRIRSILVPTDFSEEARVAFEHALRLSVAFKADLEIFHVEPKNWTADWHWAPKVVETLHRWGYLPADATEADLARLGIRVHRQMSSGDTADHAIMMEMANTHADLIVMATHGRHGVDRWIQPSVAAPVALKGAALVLLIPPGVKGFVDHDTGGGGLGRVLVPIDHRPHPAPAYDAAVLLTSHFPGEEVELATFHVGAQRPEVDLLRPGKGWKIYHWSSEGLVVSQIADTARAWQASLVVAVTEGRRNFLDAVRGSTVERLVDALTCPLLIVPADWTEASEAQPLA